MTELLSTNETRAELVFLRYLGRWSLPGERTGRAALLRLYREAFDRRSLWMGINRIVIKRELDAMLKEVRNEN